MIPIISNMCFMVFLRIKSLALRKKFAFMQSFEDSGAFNPQKNQYSSYTYLPIAELLTLKNPLYPFICM